MTGLSLVGWISPTLQTEDTIEDIRRELEGMGIEVGKWNPDRRRFEGCRVSGRALDELDPCFGWFVWGLASASELSGGADAAADS
jgi:hypothetical protein